MIDQDHHHHHHPKQINNHNLFKDVFLFYFI